MNALIELCREKGLYLSIHYSKNVGCVVQVHNSYPCTLLKEMVIKKNGRNIDQICEEIRDFILNKYFIA